MIDYYGVLALPIAAAVQYFLNKRLWVKSIFIVVMVALIALSVFQNHQYQKRLIHFDSMTEETYKIVWFKSGYPKTHGFWESIKAIDYKIDAYDFPLGYWESLKRPDNEAAKQGRREIED